MYYSDAVDYFESWNKEYTPHRVRLGGVIQNCWKHLRSFPRFLLYCLWPFFAVPEHADKVAYLDGLRGVAALLVCLGHSFGIAHRGDVEVLVNRSFPWQGEYYITCAPFIRLFVAGGPFAVGCFFVISGYVISRSPLRKLHLGQTTRLAIDLGSAFPKRFVRLYIPVLGTTFCYMTAWYIFGGEQELSWPEETLTWADNFVTQSYYFAPAGFWADRYNGHLWSIAEEVRGSYTIYTLMLGALAFQEWGTGARLWAEFAVLLYMMFLVDGIYFALFLVGMMLCDLELLSESDQLPKPLMQLQLLIRRAGGRLFWPMFIFGIWLGSAPGGFTKDYLEYGAIYRFMVAINPPASSAVWRWIMAWGAILVTIPVANLPRLKTFFESRFCQYLGKISFCLYLIHGPVLYSLGGRVYNAVGLYAEDVEPPIPNFGPIGFEFNFIVAQMFMIPFMFYVAGVATKLFDEPSTKIARYLCNPSRSTDSQPSVSLG